MTFFSWSNYFQSCFEDYNPFKFFFHIGHSIENFKRYNFSMGHIFWFCCFEKPGAVFCDYTTRDQPWVSPCSPGQSLYIFNFYVSNKRPSGVVLISKIWRRFVLLLRNAIRNTDFRPILASKNADKIGCVQYFVYISAISRPFLLGVVSIVRAFPRLQIHSKRSIHTVYESTL